ncbi:MAG: branched-chain amino acid ABC transporter permease [Deltaproteobacteria bacterium]|nr:branched-chain amino acid ABC transporter permease [Deltaproteobacteria bacterium]
MDLSDFFQLLISGLTVGGIYALMALGFHIIYVATRILNFAHGAIVLLGGLLALTLIQHVHLNFFFVLTLILVIGWLLGLFFNRVIIEPLKYLSHGIQIICLLAVSMVIENASALIWGKEPLPFPPFPGPERPYIFGNVVVQPQFLWIISLTLLGLIVTQWILKRTMIGKAIRATANNSTAAMLMGISIQKTYSVAFGIALALSALAGMITSPVTFAGGYLAIPMTIKGFTACVLGGMAGSIASILGGFLLGIMEALTAGLISTAYEEAIIMALLLVFLLVRPQGLFSRKGAE